MKCIFLSTRLHNTRTHGQRQREALFTQLLKDKFALLSVISCVKKFILFLCYSNNQDIAVVTSRA